MSATQFDLVKHTKRAARDALNNLTEPEDDILPVILSNGPRGLQIMGAIMPSSDDDKDTLADNITARIAVAQAKEAAMVCPAYLSVVDATTGQITKREETLILVYCTARKQKAWSAKVSRHDNRPPDLSIWEELGDGAFGGRFAQAMTHGLACASVVGSEMQEILDEAWAAGEVDRLVEMFIAVMSGVKSD